MINSWIEVIRTGNLSEEKEMDVVSKWLLITRSCVFSMTLLSAFIGGMLAGIDGHFHLGFFLLVCLGLVLGHASNNMVNDLFDVLLGVDTEDYPRAKYAPHPLLDNLVSKKGLIAAIMVCNVIDLIIAVYLTIKIGWPVMAFAVAGLLTSVFYVAPPLKLKHRGLGEPAIFLIWGPLMVGGTYYVMAGTVSMPVFLASVPYGLGVMAVLMGKHLDKQDKDRAKGVNTLPVVLGDKKGRLAMQLMILSFYLIIVAEAALQILPVWSLVALLSLPQAIRIVSTLSAPMPASPIEAFEMAEEVIPKDLKAQFDPNLPEEAYPLWPLWYVAWGVWWVRTAGALYVAGLMIALIF